LAVSNILHDIRFGVRLLAQSRAHTAVAVLAFGIGVGATTAMFSVINAVLLRNRRTRIQLDS
jgi:putative ABC transport system permease protein